MKELTPLAAAKMGRVKPAKLGQKESEHRLIWSCLRKLAPTNHRGVVKKTGLSEGKVQFYLSFLERAGYLWREPSHQSPRYWLIQNTGREAPRRMRGGSAAYDPNSGKTYEVKEFIQRWPGEPAAVGSPEQKSWLAMRMLRTFTVSELVSATGLEEPVLERRVKALLAFQYLRATEPSCGEAGYLLPQYRNTGPRAPVINESLGKLYDYNSKDVIHLEG